MEIDVTKGKIDQRNKGNLTPPEFNSIDEERRHGLERLASAFRMFAHFGFDEGLAGHITLRDPEYKDHFWVNPFGVHFGQMKVSDLLLVSHEGDIVIGDRPINNAAFAIHSRLHMNHPDLNAAAHSHSMYGKTFSTMGRLLEPITQDSCAFYERQAIHNHFSGVVEETEEGDRIANALGDKTVLFLQNHGILTTGPSIDIALWYYFSMERCCHSQLMADAAGETTKIPHDTAIKTREFIANDLAAWASFQPLLDMITKKEPDLLD